MLDIILGLLNKILPDLIYIIVLALLVYARALIKTWKPLFEEWVNANVSAKTQAIILTLGQEAFAYAETVFREKNGAEKLKEALAYFNANMSRCGLSNLTADVIRAAIERAWLEDKRKEMPVIEAVQLEAVKTE